MNPGESGPGASDSHPAATQSLKKSKYTEEYCSEMERLDLATAVESLDQDVFKAKILLNISIALGKYFFFFLLKAIGVCFQFLETQNPDYYLLQT